MPKRKRHEKITDKQLKHMLGEVKISDSVSIVIQKILFKNKWYVDIRKKVVTDRYTGLTAKGIFIPTDNFYEVLKILQKVKI